MIIYHLCTMRLTNPRLTSITTSMIAHSGVVGIEDHLDALQACFDVLIAWLKLQRLFVHVDCDAYLPPA